MLSYFTVGTHNITAASRKQIVPSSGYLILRPEWNIFHESLKMFTSQLAGHTLWACITGIVFFLWFSTTGIYILLLFDWIDKRINLSKRYIQHIHVSKQNSKSQQKFYILKNIVKIRHKETHTKQTQLRVKAISNLLKSAYVWRSYPPDTTKKHTSINNKAHF